MKKTNILGLTILVLSYATNAIAAGVVTDPTSYSYYVNQIKEAQKSYKQSADQFEKEYKIATEDLANAIEMKDNILDVKSSMRGNLKRAQRNLDKLAKLKGQMEEDPLLFAEETIKNRDSVGDFRDEVEDGLGDLFDTDSFIDKKGDKRSDWVSVAQRKNAARQEALKKVIVDAETARGKIDVELKDLEELSELANNSLTIKDTADVSNTIFLKMLENQQEVIRLLANISRSMAMVKYDGVKKQTTDPMAELKEKYKKLKKESSSQKQNNKVTNDDLYAPFVGLEL